MTWTRWFSSVQWQVSVLHVVSLCLSFAPCPSGFVWICAEARWFQTRPDWGVVAVWNRGKMLGWQLQHETVSKMKNKRKRNRSKLKTRATWAWELLRVQTLALVWPAPVFKREYFSYVNLVGQRTSGALTAMRVLSLALACSLALLFCSPSLRVFAIKLPLSVTGIVFCVW